jgi:hypothetical protein
MTLVFGLCRFLNRVHSKVEESIFETLNHEDLYPCHEKADGAVSHRFKNLVVILLTELSEFPNPLDAQR